MLERAGLDVQQGKKSLRKCSANVTEIIKFTYVSNLNTYVNKLKVHALVVLTSQKL